MSRWAQFNRPRPGTTWADAEPARHRRRPARPTRTSSSPGRASVRQRSSLATGERTAAVHALRSALRTPAGPLPPSGLRGMASGSSKLFSGGRATIDLCLAAFPWASFRRTKGAIKLHVGVDRRTSANVHQRDRRQDRRRHGGQHVDVPGRQRRWSADRAYLDFGWLHQLQQRGVDRPA